MTDIFPAVRTAVHLVPRDDLVQRLEEGRRRCLTLIQAPAGFGKTTLLTQWQELLRPKGVTTAWVTFSEEAWNGLLFVRALKAALEAAGLPVDSTGPMLLTKKEESVHIELTGLIRAMEDWGRPLVIILDEYEHCDTPEINQVVTQLMKQLPVFTHLAVTSRHRPSLPVARLYASGQVTLVGPDDLRLPLGHAHSLLDCYLPPDSVARVYHLTEGWAVLLQLVRLWLDAGGAPDTVMEALTSQQQEIAHFLVEQVLSSLTTEERDFLVETSFLDRFTPALGDFVRQKEGSARYLEGMTRLYPLVRPMGGDSSMVRVHPLLRAQARHLLSLRSAKEIAGLQQRAAHWYAQTGDIYMAMFHAVAAGDVELAADFFEQAGAMRLYDGEGLPLVARMIMLLPNTVRESRPRIQLAEMSMLTAFGQIDQARQLYEDLRRRTKDFTTGVPPASLPDLQADLIVARTFFLVFCDDPAPSAYMKDLEKIDLANPDVDLRIRSFIATYRAVTSLQHGDLPTAHEAIVAAKLTASDPRRPYQSTFPIIYEGYYAHIAGDLERALEKQNAALDLAESRLGTRNLAVLTAVVSKAEICLDLGDLQEAHAHFYRAQTDFTGISAWFDVDAPVLRLSFTLAFLAGGVETAAEALDRFEAARKPFCSDRLPNIIRAYRTNLAIHGGKRANIHVEPLGDVWKSLRDIPNVATWRELEAVGLAYARALIALRQSDRALEILDALELMAAQHGWRRILLECYLVRGLAFMAEENWDKAISAAKESLILAHDKGLRSPFMMEGEPAAHLLALTIKDMRSDDPLHIFATGLLQVRKQNATPVKLPFLTPREHLVLSELSRGHANKVIARNLDMSENTVKTHLKSIFRKADIRSRAEAIEFARRHYIGLS
jgi:LuxR family maltose regulon positive regulatory protein